MQEPFIGNIIMFGGNYAPLGWAFCDGSLLSIDQYPALYNLIGTTYGGDGQTSFALPNLQSRIPVHQGQGGGLSNYSMGQVGGVEQVTLITQNLPVHNHPVTSNSGVADSSDPTNNFLAAQSLLGEYTATAANAVMKTPGTNNSPGGSPHDNIMPYQSLNYVIALEGIYPSQN